MALSTKINCACWESFAQRDLNAHILGFRSTSNHWRLEEVFSFDSMYILGLVEAGCLK